MARIQLRNRKQKVIGTDVEHRELWSSGRDADPGITRYPMKPKTGYYFDPKSTKAFKGRQSKT